LVVVIADTRVNGSIPADDSGEELAPALSALKPKNLVPLSATLISEEGIRLNVAPVPPPVTEAGLLGNVEYEPRVIASTPVTAQRETVVTLSFAVVLAVVGVPPETVKIFPTA